MGIKLIWTGIVFILALSKFATGIPALEIVGAVIAVIGLVLLWLDK